MNEERTTAHQEPSEGRSVKKKKEDGIPTLKIVLDTSQLFTQTASDLLKPALRKVIEDSRKHNDIRIEWYIPDMVRWEREFQMTEAAEALLPYLSKLERLLGHSLGINLEILQGRVRDAIDKQATEMDLKPLALDTTAVDWPRVMSDAAFRKPPFEKGKTEKGFRDALIAESFLQLIDGSPKTPSRCRVALVSNDAMLIDALAERTKEYQNVRIIRSLEEIQALINTLVSNVTEEFVASVQDLATLYFFTEGNKDGLLYTARVRETIQQQYAEKLAELPATADTRENGTWHIGKANFVEKHKQRVTWLTTVTVETIAYKSEQSLGAFLVPPAEGWEPNQSALASYRSWMVPPLEVTLPANPAMFSFLNQGILGTSLSPSTRERVVVGKGRTVFHVKWSITVTANKKFLQPKIEQITFVETVWT